MTVKSATSLFASEDCADDVAVGCKLHVEPLCDVAVQDVDSD